MSDSNADFDPHIDNLPNMQPAPEVAHATKAIKDKNLLNKLYTPCIRSKSTWVVKQNKLMTPISSKFKEVYVNL